MNTEQMWTTDEDKGDDLALYVTNTFDWNRRWAEPMAANIARKIEDGTYERARLVTWLAGVPLRAGAIMYRAEIHSVETFPPAARRIAAESIADGIEEHARYIIANPTTNEGAEK